MSNIVKRSMIVVILLTAFYLPLCIMSTKISPPYLSGNADVIAVNKKQLTGEYAAPEEYALTTAPDLTAAIAPDVTTGYILIGDSRTVAVDYLMKANAAPDGFFILAASGQGFDYMMDTALPEAMMIESAYPEVSNWKYLINMGVNDMKNIAAYKNAMTELAYKRDLVFISVNPVEADPILEGLGMTNDNIRKFNAEMKSIPNAGYLDLNTYLTRNGFTTFDHLHYTLDVTMMIYDKIRAAVQA